MKQPTPGRGAVVEEAAAAPRFSKLLRAAKFHLDRECSAAYGGDCSSEGHQKLREAVLELEHTQQ